jgi:hypothetical protein
MLRSRLRTFQKKLSKFLAKYKGGRIMFDISSVNALSQGGNQFWLLVMDDHTNYCWSFFFPHKDDLPQLMLQWLAKTSHLSI